MALRFLLLLLPVLAACGEQRLPQLELAGSALGTTFKVAIVEPAATLDSVGLEAEIVATLAHIDQLASTWRSDSELSAFNQQQSSDWLAVSPEFCAALAAALEISHLTDGAFDITVGSLVKCWRADDGSQRTPSQQELDRVRDHCCRRANPGMPARSSRL